MQILVGWKIKPDDINRWVTRTICKKCSAQESIFKYVHLKDPDRASILQNLTPEYFNRKNTKDRRYRWWTSNHQDKMSSSPVLFCPQPNDIQFTVAEEERNQEIFTFKKLESENFDWNRWMDYQNDWRSWIAAVLYNISQLGCYLSRLAVKLHRLINCTFTAAGDYTDFMEGWQRNSSGLLARAQIQQVLASVNTKLENHVGGRRRKEATGKTFKSKTALRRKEKNER